MWPMHSWLTVIAIASSLTVTSKAQCENIQQLPEADLAQKAARFGRRSQCLSPREYHEAVEMAGYEQASANLTALGLWGAAVAAAGDASIMQAHIGRARNDPSFVLNAVVLGTSATAGASCLHAVEPLSGTYEATWGDCGCAWAARVAVGLHQRWLPHGNFQVVNNAQHGTSIVGITRLIANFKNVNYRRGRKVAQAADVHLVLIDLSVLGEAEARSDHTALAAEFEGLIRMTLRVYSSAQLVLINSIADGQKMQLWEDCPSSVADHYFFALNETVFAPWWPNEQERCDFFLTEKIYTTVASYYRIPVISVNALFGSGACGIFQDVESIRKSFETWHGDSPRHYGSGMHRLISDTVLESIASLGHLPRNNVHRERQSSEPKATFTSVAAFADLETQLDSLVAQKKTKEQKASRNNARVRTANHTALLLRPPPWIDRFCTKSSSARVRLCLDDAQELAPLASFDFRTKVTSGNLPNVARFCSQTDHCISAVPRADSPSGLAFCERSKIGLCIPSAAGAWVWAEDRHGKLGWFTCGNGDMVPLTFSNLKCGRDSVSLDSPSSTVLVVGFLQSYTEDMGRVKVRVLDKTPAVSREKRTIATTMIDSRAKSGQVSVYEEHELSFRTPTALVDVEIRLQSSPRNTTVSGQCPTKFKLLTLACFRLGGVSPGEEGGS